MVGWRGDPALKMAARQLMSNRSLTFVASPLLRLETLPKAMFRKNVAETEFFESLFSLVSEWISIDDALIAEAMELGRRYDVANIDALHVASALRAGVNRFVTAEKPGRPLYRVSAINPTYLLDA